jgi:hypothetical protein
MPLGALALQSRGIKSLPSLPGLTTIAGERGANAGGLSLHFHALTARVPLSGNDPMQLDPAKHYLVASGHGKPGPGLAFFPWARG